MQSEDKSAAGDGGEAFTDAFSEPEPADAGADGGDKDKEPQDRDERGRFAGRQEPEGEAKVEGGEQRQAGDDGEEPRHRVPLSEYLSEREKRQEAERQAKEFERRLAAIERQRKPQEPEEVPDLIANPEAFVGFLDKKLGGRVKSVEEMVQNRIIDMTFAVEHETHGKTFEEAYTALQQAVARRDPEANRIVKAPNPGRALMRWHRQRTAMAAVGDDLDGYKKRLRDEFKKDPEFRKEFMAELETEARGSPERPSTVTRLPSLNRAAGAARNAGSLADEDVFENAFGGRKRA